MHDHAHGHAHHDARDANRRRLSLVLVLAISYSVVEVLGGLWTSSLALLADAFHLLSDVAALALSLFAAWMAQRPATARRTFGHSRAEILAALANGVGLAVMAIMVSVSAMGRFSQPADVNGLGVVLFASGALVYEGISLWLLRAGAEHNLNMRGAWLHVMSDALGSLGAIAAGLAIWAYGWHWADPAASLLISALILHSAWRLVREAVDVLMETAPAHLDVDEIHTRLRGLPGVQSVHDLHVWTIGSGETSLSSHVIASSEGQADKVQRAVREMLRDRFEIVHTTIQVEESDAADCEGACANGEDDAGTRSA
jgi:cobalt-zinc-cadmium efflux system protein